MSKIDWTKMEFDGYDFSEFGEPEIYLTLVEMPENPSRDAIIADLQCWLATNTR